MNDRCSTFGERNQISTLLIEAHIPGLRRFALALLRGDRERADDLVQDGLVAALARWHQLRDKRHLRAWIYTILFNRFVTEQHRHRRHAERMSPIEFFEDDLPGVEGGQEEALTHRDLLRAFGELPDEQRSLLLLIGVEGFAYAEAALVLGVPIGTVMSRLSRGRERLRQYMDAGPPSKNNEALQNSPAASLTQCCGGGVSPQARHRRRQGPSIRQLENRRNAAALAAP